MDTSDVIARARAAQAATPPVKKPWALAGRVDASIPPRIMDAEMLFARHFDRYGR